MKFSELLLNISNLITYMQLRLVSSLLLRSKSIIAMSFFFSFVLPGHGFWVYLYKISVKDVCGYFQCASFPRLEIGKVVWVLSFDLLRIRINTAFRYSYVISVFRHFLDKIKTGPRSAVGNVSGYRCVSDCRSRGREFDPGMVPYFYGDWSWNNFYDHSPPFRWFIQEGLLSVTSESMCTNYWLTACSSLSRKKCG